MAKNIHKYVDLSKLPKKKKYIDWERAYDCKLYFEYGNIKGYLKILNYHKCENKIEVSFNDKTELIKTASLTRGQLGTLLGNKTNKYKVEIGTRFKDSKRDIILIDKDKRPNCNGVMLKYYKYHCNIDGNEDWIEESHLLGKNGGCNVCAHAKILRGHNDIATTEPWMIDWLYDKNDAYIHASNSHELVAVKCKYCGKKRSKYMRISELNRYNSIGCDCSDYISYPEKLMTNVLEQAKENVIRQYNKSDAKWCLDYKFDFYLENHDTIIETHGGQHYNESKFKITYEEQHKIDLHKEELGKKNLSGEYIVIDCRYSKLDYIKTSILTNKKLNELIDLSNINWHKANEFATSNLVKEVCNYYDEHENCLLQEIGKIFGIHRDTVRYYLVRGTELGWCLYNPSLYNQKKKIKSIEFDKTFNSIRECARELKRKYNIEINYTGIRRVLNGEIENYRGYHFIEIEGI